MMMAAAMLHETWTQLKKTFHVVRVTMVDVDGLVSTSVGCQIRFFEQSSG